MALRLITPPPAQLITLAEAKAACRLDGDDGSSDTDVTGLLAAASEVVQGLVQRRYLAQTWEWVRDDWTPRMQLPLAPGGDCQNISVAFVKYIDTQGNQQTLDSASQYWVMPSSQTVAIVQRWFVLWPWLGDGQERVVIRFAIATPAAGVPEHVKQAVKLLVSHWFRNRDAVVGVDNRDSSTPLPYGVEALLTAERWT